MATLQREKFVTTAVIERLYTKNNRGEVYFEADYSFVVGDGQFIGRQQHGKSRLIPSAFATLRVGAPAEVTYLPSRPDISELTLSMQTVWAVPWMAFRLSLIITSGLLALCVLIAYAIGSVVFRELRLVKWGSVTSAKLVDEEIVRIKGRATLTLAYEFRDDSGRLFKGKRSSVPTSKQLGDPASKALNSAIREDPIVLYDQNRPSRNLLYPPLMVRCG